MRCFSLSPSKNSRGCGVTQNIAFVCAFAAYLASSGLSLPSLAQQRIAGRVITVDSVPVWKAIVRLRPLSLSLIHI